MTTVPKPRVSVAENKGVKTETLRDSFGFESKPTVSVGFDSDSVSVRLGFVSFSIQFNTILLLIKFELFYVV